MNPPLRTCATAALWIVLAACNSDSRGPARTDDRDAGDSGIQDAGLDSFTPDAALGTNDGDPPPDSSQADAPADTAVAPPESGAPDTSAPAPDSGLGPEPISQFCGDAIRDPVLEECDDGASSSPDDSCTSDCRIRPAYATLPESTDAGPLYPVHRSLGSAPHVVSASRKGFGIVYSEGSSSTGVYLQAFDYDGHRLGDPINVSEGRASAAVPNPAVAALDDGKYVVAWTDGFDGTPDIAMRTVDPVTRALGSVRIAHATQSGSQQDPDVVLSGTTLVVAWSDLFAVHVRRFSATLSPLGVEESLPAVTGVQGGVSLAATAQGWALAWRANTSGLDAIRVVTGTTSWQTDAWLPAPSGDRPALVPVASGQLLTLFSVGNPGTDSGSPSGGLRFALLDPATPGTVTSAPLPDPTQGASGAFRPRAVRVGNQTYATWGLPGATYSTATLAELSGPWSSAASVAVLSSQRLSVVPLDADESNPAFTFLPRYWSNVLVGAWEHGGIVNGRPIPDIQYVMRPLPFVTLGPIDAGDGG